MEWLDSWDFEELEALADLIDEAPTQYILPVRYLSVSQVNRWLGCGKSYYYRYVQGIRHPASSPMVRGQFIHKVGELANQYKIDTDGLMPPKEWLDDTVSTLAADYVSRVEDWDDNVPDAGAMEKASRELVRLYHRDILPHTRPKAIEMAVFANIRDTIPFIGYVDLVEYSDVRFDEMASRELTAEATSLASPLLHPTDVLRDLKVSGRKKSQSEIDNSLQLSAYAAITGTHKVGFDNLVETKTGKCSSNRLHSIRTVQEKEHALDIIEDAAHAISQGVFPKTSPESWMCNDRWCPFWDRCRGKQLQVTVPGTIASAPATEEVT